MGEIDQAEQVYESRYKIERGDDYFIIRGGDGRNPVRITLSEGGTTFEVNHADKKDESPKRAVWYSNHYHYGTAGLIQAYLLNKKIADGIMADWEGDPEKRKKSKIWALTKLRAWAINKTGKALAKRVKEERLRLLEKADPIILAVQKAVFSANGSIISNDVLDPDFYTRATPYYIKDIIQYRAAAMTTFEFDYGVDRYSVVKDDWRKLYANNGEIYGSLRKTLTNLPGGIPISILRCFPNIRLQRPIYSRRELVFMLSCGNHHSWETDSGRYGNGISDDIKHILLKATADEITRAAKKLSEHQRQPLSLRKAFNVHAVAQYIMDAAPTLTHSKNGNVVGLMEKAIEYHRQASWNSCGIPPDVLTTTPPVPLPTNKGVHFLKDVREVVEEGERQHHCVGSYSKSAVKGDCFLFHIEYAGETATAQVDNRGNLTQCYGPYNKKNKATEWAKKVLMKWAEPLRKTPYVDNPKTMLEPIFELDDNMPF